MGGRFIEKPRRPVSGAAQHLPCIVLVDTSGTMSGYEDFLEEGLREMKEAIIKDDIARNSVEIAIMTFDDDVYEKVPFGNIQNMEIPHITTGGRTCTHAAITYALQRVHERKAEYKSLKLTSYEPWIWLLTDGQSNDPDNGSFDDLLEEQKKEKCVFFGVAVGSLNNEAEEELAGMHINHQLLQINKNEFKSAFKYIYNSVSQSMSRHAQNSSGKLIPNLDKHLKMKQVNINKDED